MAITYPLSVAAFQDVIDVAAAPFRLQDNQELSGLGSGQVLGAELSPPLWVADVSLFPAFNDDAVDIQALIDSLEGVLKSFYLYDPRASYPKAYPRASALPQGFYRHTRWDFTSALDGWTAANANASAAGGNLVLTSTALHPYVSSPATLAISGNNNRQVRVRMRRTSGSGSYTPRVQYVTAGHGLDVNYRKDLPAADFGNGWVEHVFDMAALTAGGNDWISSTVTRIILQLVSAPAGQSFEIDWIAIGNTTLTDQARIASLGANNKSLSLSGLTEGFALSRGDMLAFDYGDPARRALHRIAEAAVADAAGITPVFEVRPHIRPGASAGLPVRLVKPAAKMILMPGSLQVSAADEFRTAISFQAIQKIP